MIFIDFFISAERLTSSWILQDQHFISTLLHPSLKRFDKAPNEKAKALDLIQQELTKRTRAPSVDDKFTSKTAATTASSASPMTTARSSKNLFTRCFDVAQSSLTIVATPLQELEAYMALNVQIDEKTDVLSFWREHAKLFPTLSEVARDIFSIPAANTIIERLFSTSKITVTDRRSSLAPDKVNKLLFLKKNYFLSKQIREEGLKDNRTQSKRGLSTSGDGDGQLILLDEDNSNSIHSSTTKRSKTIDDSNSLSDDFETTDDSKGLDNLLANL